MKIAFVYPPYTFKGKYPNLPQNRQFIYTASREVRLYPVVMAQGATRLKDLNHKILWLDAITRRIERFEYDNKLYSFAPDMVIYEAKVPIIKKLIKEVNLLKKRSPKTLVVLVGDHVTYYPEETLKGSKADYILTGGDYDFLLVNLITHLEKGNKLETGIWYRNKKGKIITTGRYLLNHNLNTLPVIDRQLTRWQDYGEAYLYHPCAYVMFGRGCAIDRKRCGACTFCIWQQGLWNYSGRLVSSQKAILEVKNLVFLGVKEIFDDAESGVLSNYLWLTTFYKLLKKEKLLGKVVFSSNARGDQLNNKACRLLKKIGYRLLKIGLEAGTDKTLTRINKKEKIEDIIQGVKNAKDEGLVVMLTVMTGYPWEEKEDVAETYRVTRELMLYKTHAGDCLQASVIIPYPKTVLWREAVENKWLKIKPFDFEKYDMSAPILKAKYDSSLWCKKIWSIQSEPLFILKSALSIKSLNDLTLLLRGAKSLIGHLIDFSGK